MSTLAKRTLRRLLTPTLIGAALTGCSALDVKQDVEEGTPAMVKAPQSSPNRSITNFSPALRCMDSTLIRFGVENISTLIEEVPDQTRKIPAGARDMLIKALSEMNRRSGAIRTVAFSPTSTPNLNAFQLIAERRDMWNGLPQYNIVGSITQWDENLIRSQKDGSVGVNPYLMLGLARDAASDYLALDLSVVSATDSGVLPGVTSSNALVIYKEGKGFDADATIRKFGLTYNMSLTKSEGKTQALRNLVELAAVELVGKLTRTPYWKCLGADGSAEEVKAEVSDWYYAAASSPKHLVAYFQRQLNRRGWHSGPVDGVMSPDFAAAVSAFRARLGMSAEPKLDEPFFHAYLNADQDKLGRSAGGALPAANGQIVPAPVRVPSAPVPAQPGTTSAALGQSYGEVSRAPAPTAQRVAMTSTAPASPVERRVERGSGLALDLATQRGPGQAFRRGEVIQLQATPSQDAYLYCYMEDGNRKVQRFFPNRFRTDAFVRAGETVSLPGGMPFQLLASTRGQRETIACFATARDVLKELPPKVAGTNFENLGSVTLDRVRSSFAEVAQANLAEGDIHVEVE